MLFGILGPVEARRADGTAVAVGGPRVRSLLALLLLNAGRIVPTETLVDGLYGGSPPAGAANALQSQVSRLRRGLRDDEGTDKLVEFHAAGYRLAVDPERVDAHRFARLAREGRHALARRDHTTAERCLAEALGLWRGPALADIRDAPFAPVQADAWAEQRLDAVADRCETRLALGQAPELVGELRRLVAEHPLRERFVGQLMRALYGAGRQAEALAAFDGARTRLADELGADPSAELAAIHVDILRAAPSLTAAVAPPADLAADPGPAGHRGLPAPLTSFVGRDGELDRIGALLTTARLVTLTGPGGSGKTRLSVEAGRRLPGEVCFVELASVRRRDELVQALLSALGLRETVLSPLTANPSDDATTRLLSGLAARRVLLILDNCEQIVDDVARLAHAILGACPGVRILATSREALGVTGETLCPVPTLAIPDEGAPLDVARAAPVIRLFADRAGAVRPGFTVDAGNLAAVRGICSALDGLPLAVELAAARLRALPLDEIAARLDDRFRLLSRGNRSAAPRHRTLRAVVEWSWELLDASEQELARRLTVFAGGATIEAAARVCGLSDADAVELLADLADKSLIEGSAGRYRMSETVRLFGSERLAEAGERERLDRAHAEYFLDLAQRAEPRLRTGDQLVWLDRLRAEHANLRGALRWAVAADPELGLRLCAALTWYWWLRGLRREATGPAGELIAAVGDAPPGMTEEYLLCLLTSLHAETTPGGEPRTELVARAQRLFYALEETPRQPEVFVILGMATGPLGAADRSRTEQLIGDDPWSQAVTLIGYGFMNLYGGELTEGERNFREALARFQAIGDRWGQANCFDQLAVFVDWAGDTRGSLPLMDEALELMRQLGITEDIDDLLLRRAEMSVRLGDLDTARRTFEHVIASASATGRTASAALGRAGLGDLARHEGRPADAARIQERALADCPSDSFDSAGAHAMILTWLGWTSLALGDAARARALAYAAIDLTYRQANLMTAADGIEVLAAVALREGDAAEAAVLLGLVTATRGADIPGRVDVDRVREGAREALGDEVFDAALARGRAVPRDAALDHLERGRARGV